MSRSCKFVCAITLIKIQACDITSHSPEIQETYSCYKAHILKLKHHPFMINKDLFYYLTGTPRKLPMKPAPRLIAHPKATANIFISEGYAKEFYSMDGKSRIYSWFWGKDEYIIPTSGYSNIILSDGAVIIEMNYSKAIKLLKKEEDARTLYRGIREQHYAQIAERIKEMKTLPPLQRYISLITRKPWVLEKIPKSDIASYLNISVSALERFSSMKA